MVIKNEKQIEKLKQAIVLADADLLKQRRARLLYKSNYLPTEQIEI
jgi:hypothetical protein